MNSLASLAEYGSDDDMGDSQPTNNTVHLKPEVTLAPLHSAPAVSGQVVDKNQMVAYDPKRAFFTTHNPLKRDLLAPTAGPQHPEHSEAFMPHLGNAAHQNGFIAPTSVAPWAFEEQFHTFNSMGYAVGVDGAQVGDVSKASANDGQSVSTLQPKAKASTESMSSSSSSTTTTTRKGKSRKGGDMALESARAEAVREFELGQDPEVQNGPWAEYRDDDEELLKTIEAENDARREVAAAENQRKIDEYDIDADHDRRDERKMSHLLPARHNKDTTVLEASSIWHGKEDDKFDYQGRSWLEPPLGTRGLSSEEGDVHDCYLPKKLVHRFTGHSKGVQAIRWFPDTGHLLLSASYDGKVKIWDSHNSRRIRRTYHGHSQGVRDVNFSHDGRHFLTASFDRYVCTEKALQFEAVIIRICVLLDYNANSTH